MKLKAILLLSVFMTIAVVSYAQEKEHEISSTVPELEKFHDVIYPMWHTAWPEKDVKMLKSLFPQVEKDYTALAKAKLPGILRDKKGKWDAGIKNFTAAYEAYKSAASKEDAQPLLDAAEKLHAGYEALVRVIRPVLKEVDDFHKDLYMLYHYYTPENNYAGVKTASVSLTKKMLVLKNAQLSEKQKSKKDAFDKAVNELDNSVNALALVVKEGNDKNKIKTAVESLHSRYQAVEAVFD